jgi:hypothetical protein
MASNKRKTAFGSAAVTTTISQLVGSSASRVSLLIQNVGGTIVYVGPAGLTAANGIRLDPGASLESNTNDPWNAITASGTGELRILEVTE